MPAAAQDTIKIGELNSYKVFAAFLEPYKKGWELAVEEVNAAGGVLGKKIEIVSRDDNGNPADAVRVAEELLSREKVAFLIGTFPSNVGLAVADFAKQRKTLFIAAEPLTDKIVWDAGNAYTFRLRTSTYMQTAMLIPDAAKLKKKRWAIVYPNYEYGQSATAAFKKLLKEKQPDVEFVAEQAPPLGKIDAGAVAQALADAKPDAIFSSLFGPDLAKFVREGTQRGVFKGVEVFNLLGGEPEYLDPLKEEAPDGWYVTGYPWSEIKTPEHRQVPRGLPGEVQGLPAARLDRRLLDRDVGGRRDQEGGLARPGQADRGDGRPVAFDAVRRDHLSRARPSVDDGRLCRPARRQGRQGLHEGMALRRRQGRPAERRRGQEDAAGQLTAAKPRPARSRERLATVSTGTEVSLRSRLRSR